jgi:transposase
MSQQQQSIQPQSTQPNLNGKLKVEAADPEVVPRAKRKQFSAEYKLGILAEAAQCQEPGQVGALLRREGLYSSHLTRWRQLRVGSGQRGRKPDPQGEELSQLRQENRRLQTQLAQAEWVMDVQKKLWQLLGLRNEIPAGEAL